VPFRGTFLLLGFTDVLPQSSQFCFIDLDVSFLLLPSLLLAFGCRLDQFSLLLLCFEMLLVHRLFGDGAARTLWTLSLDKDFVQ
jgi:hypothetical protein